MSNPSLDDWSHATVAEIDEDRRSDIVELIYEEVTRSYTIHGSPRWSRHEAIAIIREEFEESWEAVKGDAPYNVLLKELIQTAAMCVRFIETEPRFSIERLGGVR